MKQARLVFTALAVLMAGTAALAVAGDTSKQSSTSAAAISCPHAAASAAVAASGSCAHATSSAAAAACKSAKGTSAAAAAAGMCSGKGLTTTAARSEHADCDACADMSSCEQEIESAGASTQVVALKNGVMFVYTADSAVRVHAVQAAMARRNDRMIQLASSGDKAHLCGSCKQMRGAAASGKLTREVVNIEGGCLTLVTSVDPAIVAKIHAMSGITTASKVKS